MIHIQNAAIRFGGKVLFEDVSFQIGSGDRVGLTGRNGAGKSTLLSVIAGYKSLDDGSITHSKGYEIGYLHQHIDIHSDITVLEEAKKAFIRFQKIEEELQRIQHSLMTRTDYESQGYLDLVNQLNDKEHLLSMSGYHKLEEEVHRVLKGLGFELQDMEHPVSALSGGWQMRIELAKILLQCPDLILLDEPTNHLDIESIIWLESFLKQYEGAIMLVSHDKTFLDNVTNRTIEITMGGIQDYRCNYSNYLIQRQERIEKQIQAKKNQDDQVKQMQRNVERFRAKKNKAKFAQTLIRKLDKMDRIEVDKTDQSSIRFHFPPAPRSGKVVVKAANVSKKYENKPVFSNVHFEILRGEKIAFVGKNGAGKTTLSRMIVGELDYTGTIEMGYNVHLAYFAQQQAVGLDETKTVFQTIDEAATGEMRLHVRSLLGAFLFSGDESKKKVKVLSGGERSRLALAKLLLEPSNLLILDEPTNHLDMAAKNTLKKAIQQFEGTAIIVSHDRDFLQGLTDKVFEFSNQTVKEHDGDILEFLRHRSANDFRAYELDKEVVQEQTNDKPKQKSNLSNKEQYLLRKELKSIEKKIETAEKKIQEKELRLKNPESFQQLSGNQHFFDEYNMLKSKLENLMKEWETIAGKLEV